jgi:toxin ParE1/3/4
LLSATRNPPSIFTATSRALFSQLPQHPYLYRLGRVSGTRELVAHPNYIVVYRVSATAIEIVSILHSRQQFP